MSVKLEFNPRKIGEFLTSVKEVALKKALASSLNKAMASAKTDANKKARETINIRSRDVNEAMKVSKAIAKKGFDMRALMSISAKPIPLSRFSPRVKVVKSNQGKRKGVTVRVLRSKGKVLVGGGFFVEKGTNGIIFKRTTESRLPIKKLHSTSVGSLFKREENNKALGKKAIEVFNKNFDHEFNFYLGKVKIK